MIEARPLIGTKTKKRLGGGIDRNKLEGVSDLESSSLFVVCGRAVRFCRVGGGCQSPLHRNWLWHRIYIKTRVMQRKGSSLWVLVDGGAEVA